MKKINADRRSIGIDSKVNFTTQEFVLEEGGIIYLTSDGYVDQNDPERMKFGSRNFHQLISSVATLPLKEPKARFEAALDQHQKDAEQRDDSTIMGIKV